ncbi:secretin receptor-like isoform X2 [Babylonia areolata]
MDEKEQIQRLAEARYACWLRMKRHTNHTRFSEAEGGGGVECPVAWDNVLCWSAAPPGTLQTQPCPAYIHGFDTLHNATRLCTANGTWFFNPVTNRTWTNYSACFDKAVLPKAKDITEFAEHADSLKLLYTIGYGVSLGSLIIAVFILCCCRRLKSKSNTLHVNLFLAFILRAVLSFAKEALFVQHLGFQKDVRRMADGRLEFIPDGTHWECRTLVSLFFYSICVSQMWIFVEGLYLHMLIYSTLSAERRGVRLYVLTGWFSPLLFFIPWVIAKVTTDNYFCWTISTKPNLFWILNAPLMATIVVNFVFFLNIVRVLVSRVRSADRHTGRQQQYRRLAKFILVLVPLFGVLYVVIYIIFPMSFSAHELDIRQLYIEMTYNSFQGFILAVVFCFLNEEVHAEIRWLWMRNKTLRRDSLAQTRSFVLSSFRKHTVHTRALSSRRAHGRTLVLTANNSKHSSRSSGGAATTTTMTMTQARACRPRPDSGVGSEGGGGRSQLLLVRLKDRARKVFRWKGTSSDPTRREGVIDTRYDCVEVPDIDAQTFCNGSSERVFDVVEPQLPLPVQQQQEQCLMAGRMNV